MSTAKPLKSQKGTSLLERPRFSPGLLLEDEDLNAGVAYTQEINRLLFRSLFGCGVICGLEVEAALTCERRKLGITVSPGLALDCQGNPIHVTKAQPLVYDPDCEPLPPYVWVTVCYDVKCCRPRDVSCDSDDASLHVHTRSRDGFVIHLYGEQPECACSCERPPAKAPAPPDECEPEEPETTQEAKYDSDVKIEAERFVEGNEECRCYADHFTGVCECDCGCECVVIAKISTRGTADTSQESEKDPAKDTPLAVDRSMVRWIRPILNGFFRCFVEGRIGRSSAYRSSEMALKVSDTPPQTKRKRSK